MKFIYQCNKLESELYLCIFHCYNFSFGNFLCKHKENLVKGIYKK